MQPLSCVALYSAGRDLGIAIHKVGLLPIAFHLDPANALIMFASIYRTRRAPLVADFATSFGPHRYVVIVIVVIALFTLSEAFGHLLTGTGDITVQPLRERAVLPPADVGHRGGDPDGVPVVWLQPGPQSFSESEPLAWTLITSLYVGNVMLLVLNLPLTRTRARLLTILAYGIYAGVFVFATLAAYAAYGTAVDLLTLWGWITGAGRTGDVHGGPRSPQVTHRNH